MAQKSRRNGTLMDSISLPSQDKINNLKDGYESKKIVKSTSFDDFADITRPTFDRATKASFIPERNDDDEDDEDDFIPKRDPNRKANYVGVKVGKTYIAKTRLAKMIVLSIVAVLAIIFFFPPFVFNNADLSGSENRNIFREKGLTELKEDILKNTSVYDISALSSEQGDSYRVCTVVVNITNITPFELKIPSYAIVSADSDFQSRFVYSASSKPTGDVIPPFASEPVQIEVLVNVAGLNEAQFDKAVTSLVLRTDGMKKKIGRNTYCPCIPSVIGVSNAITFSLDD